MLKGNVISTSLDARSMVQTLEKNAVVDKLVQVKRAKCATLGDEWSFADDISDTGLRAKRVGSDDSAVDEPLMKKSRWVNGKASQRQADLERGACFQCHQMGHKSFECDQEGGENETDASRVGKPTKDEP